MASQGAKLLFTLSGPPTKKDGRPCPVSGVVLLGNCLYVVYDCYNAVQVFDCEDGYKKFKEIEVEEMEHPWDMVGSSMTSELFILNNYNILRVDTKTELIDVFIKHIRPTYYPNVNRFSLVENRLLMTSFDSLVMYDIKSGERIRKIPYKKEWKKHGLFHAVESITGSFFVSHRPSVSNNCTVSEIDSEGRVIGMFNSEGRLYCFHLALNSLGCVIVTDAKKRCVVLIDDPSKCEKLLIDKKRLHNSPPLRLDYNTNNNRLIVGLENGTVKIFQCNE